MSNNVEKEKTYWFPAQRYGWGWGLPSSWQGWVVLVLYLGFITFSVYCFPPEDELTFFLLSVLLSTAFLIAICWLKGEPPKWRWGKR
ncbi:MAG TPA: hypothetical protein PLA74_04835 [Syntrophales bacterium]|nr:hypothetical protein [Syntrophales bacterium]HPQ43978.1 hypothetical protein [Syntrophales bacterium]